MTTIPGPVEVANTIKAKNNLNFPVVEDTDIWGGFQVVATTAERDAIPSAKLKVGMLVSVQADGNVYKLLSVSPMTWQIDAGGSSIGGAIPGATAGSVLFVGAGSVLAQDNANFFWNDANNRLGLGTATPSSTLHVVGGVTQSGGAYSFTSAVNSSIAVTGAAELIVSSQSGDILVSSDNGHLVLNGGSTSLNAIDMVSAGGVQLSAQSAYMGVSSGTFVLTAGATSPLISSVVLDSFGALVLDAYAASRFSTSFGDLTLEATGLSNFVHINSNAGISINAGTGISTITGSQIELWSNGFQKFWPDAAGAANTVLRNDGTSQLTWGKVALTTDVSGILPVANGGTGATTAFTPGSVIFAGAGGVYSQNNSSLSWDNTNLRLTANAIVSRAASASVVFAANADNILTVKGTGSSATTWRGRITAGGDNVAFLMGEFNSQAWLGSHNAALNAWADFYINPDGTTKTFIGDSGGAAAAPVPILTVDNSTGRVGVGNTSPAYIFSVNSGTAGIAFDAATQTIGTTFGTSGNLQINAHSPGASSGPIIYMGGSTRGDLDKNATRFNVGATEYMRIDGDFTGHTLGNVGIRTSLPTAALDVRGTVLAKNTANSTTAFQVQNAAASTILDVDTTNGYVGVGTNAPTSKLTLVDGMFTQRTADLNAVVMRTFPTSGSGKNRAIDFYEATDINNSAVLTVGLAPTTGWISYSEAGAFIYSGSNGSGVAQNIYICANSTTADATKGITVQANTGKIGIGTTSPASTLSVGATSQFQVNSTGNLTKVNNVTYSFPPSQATVSGQVLTNDSSGNLTWTSPSSIAGFADGSAASPSIFFTADTDTGIYRATANHLAVTTAGVQRLLIKDDEAVFNDVGLAYNFRVAGDADINTFVVQASTDRVGIGTASPTAKLNVAGGSLVSGVPALAVTGTLSSTVATQRGVTMFITGAGTGAQQIEGVIAGLSGGGYTGTGASIGANIYNESVGAGNQPFAQASGNFAVRGQAYGASATGHNVGFYATAQNALRNFGFVSVQTTNSQTNGYNVGIATSAHNAASGGVRVGGFFSINTTFLPSEPTLTSAALIADNTSAADPIFIARDNGTPVFTIADGGAVTATSTITASNLSGTNTGDQTITLTSDVTGSGTGSFATTIAAGVVTNSKLANMATSTFKGRTTAGAGSPEDLTGTQATALLDAFTSTLKGLTPASGGGTTNYLRADGTWTTVAASSISGILGVANGGTGTSTAFTPGSIVFAGSSGVYSQDNANLFWNDTNNRLGVRTASPTHVVHIQAGSLDSGQSAIETTATLANPGTTFESGASFQITANGSANSLQFGVLTQISGSYTGSGQTTALSFRNDLAGTGSLLFNDGLGMRPDGNRGIVGHGVSVTTGNNSAVVATAGSGNRNFGGYFSANIDKASALNVGVYGAARNISGGSTEIGGMFHLYSSTTFPTFVSAALLADNGDSSSPVFLARDNGTAIFSIVDGGAVTAKNTSNSVTAFQVQNAGAQAILDVDTTNQRVGINTAAPSFALEVQSDIAATYTSSTSASTLTAIDAAGSGHYAQVKNFGTTAAGSLAGETVAGASYIYATGVSSTKLVIGHLQNDKPVIVVQAGQDRLRFTGNGTTGETVVNEAGGDYDFRVESDGNANMLFVDGTNNRVGVGTATPASTLSVGASSQFQVNSTGNLTKINDVGYSFPASQATVSGQVLSNDSTGNLTWVVPPALKTPISTKTANYTITTADGTIIVNAASGPVTITLPAAASATEYHFTVKKVDTSSNTVTIAGTIDGTTNYVLYSQYEAIRVQSDGSVYWII